MRYRYILISCALLEDLINIMLNNMYYAKSKNAISFPMRPLIYKSNFRIDNEITQAITAVSFPNLLPTYFFKDLMFSQASVVR